MIGSSSRLRGPAGLGIGASARPWSYASVRFVNERPRGPDRQSLLPSASSPERLHQISAFAAFVTSQVDRCNSLLVGAPKRLLDCLLSVLNAAAIYAAVQSEKI